MLTKYYIEIDGIKHEIPQRCIKNWDEVKCAYKRADFSGVTRSFTSQFEFVGEMYEKLRNLYLRDGVNAHATLSLYLITNNWEWVEQFASDLDFTSLTWDNYTAKINCIDDSLAAAIKARKSTKYEFVVGHDIPATNTLNFDRITMQNSCVHEIQGNGTDDWYGDYVDLYPTNLKRLPTYVVGNGETYENSPILFTDQTEEENSAFLEVVNTANGLEIEIEISTNGRTSLSDVVEKANIFLKSYSKGQNNYTELGQVFSYDSNAESKRHYLGLFPSFDVLKRKYPQPPKNVWALVGNDWANANEAYITPIGNIDEVEWIATAPWSSRTHRGGPITAKGCSLFVYRNRFRLDKVSKNTCFALFYECAISNPHSLRQKLLAIKSKIQTKWLSRAKTISVDALKTTDVCKALLDKITDSQLNVDVYIDNTDSRLLKTYLFAAESIRNIPGAKFYTTFNDFCGWMECVFGYSYYLGPRIKAKFKRTQDYSLEWPLSANDHLLHTMCPGGHGRQVVLIAGASCFAVLGDDYNTDKSLNFYTKWDGSDAYNDPQTGRARLDTLFYDETYNNGIYFNSEYDKQEFSGNVTRGIYDSQSIHFVPRNSLFVGDNIVKLSNIRDLKFTINSGMAYSSVTVGYERQEYEAECGRDEWNFSAQYNTGIDKLEKTLTLNSKYRADCYGFEFLAQERAKDTTDNKSDNTVFFVYCNEKVEETEESSASSRGDENESEIKETTTLEVERDGCVISGALSDDVFNGEYSPYHCIIANAKYIAATRCPSTLKFASFDGNTDVCIDGISGNTDIQLNEQLFTLGEIDFISPEVDVDLDVNALYEVKTDGVIYRGFLKEVSFKYANNEVAKYKLIVRDIEL